MKKLKTYFVMVLFYCHFADIAVLAYFNFSVRPGYYLHLPCLHFCAAYSFLIFQLKRNAKASSVRQISSAVGFYDSGFTF